MRNRPAARVMASMGLALALWASAAGATTVLPLDLDRLVAGAQTIVHVRCTGNAVQPDPTVGVATITTFAVLDHAKGPVDRVLQLRQAGGELDGVAVDFHVPKFRVGEEYVLFVPAPSKLGFASPVALAQGVFGVVDRAGAREVGRGRDFAQLLAGGGTLPPGVAARMAPGRPAPESLDVGDFMALLRIRAAPR